MRYYLVVPPTHPQDHLGKEPALLLLGLPARVRLLQRIDRVAQCAVAVAAGTQIVGPDQPVAAGIHTAAAGGSIAALPRPGTGRGSQHSLSILLVVIVVQVSSSGGRALEGKVQHRRRTDCVDTGSDRGRQVPAGVDGEVGPGGLRPALGGHRRGRRRGLRLCLLLMRLLGRDSRSTGRRGGRRLGGGGQRRHGPERIVEDVLISVGGVGPPLGRRRGIPTIASAPTVAAVDGRVNGGEGTLEGFVEEFAFFLSLLSLRRGRRVGRIGVVAVAAAQIHMRFDLPQRRRWGGPGQAGVDGVGRRLHSAGIGIGTTVLLGAGGRADDPVGVQGAVGGEVVVVRDRPGHGRGRGGSGGTGVDGPGGREAGLNGPPTGAASGYGAGGIIINTVAAVSIGVVA